MLLIKNILILNHEKIQPMDKETTVRNFFKFYNEQKIDGMCQLFVPKAQVVFLPWKERGIGEVEVLGKIVCESMIEAFSGLTHTLQKIKTDVYGHMICEAKAQGTQVRDFWIIYSQGLSFEIDCVFLFHFEEQELIDSMSINWDLYDWRRQLGAV
jgi:hypothetical protein